MYDKKVKLGMLRSGLLGLSASCLLGCSAGGPIGPRSFLSVQHVLQFWASPVLRPTQCLSPPLVPGLLPVSSALYSWPLPSSVEFASCPSSISRFSLPPFGPTGRWLRGIAREKHFQSCVICRAVLLQIVDKLSTFGYIRMEGAPVHTGYSCLT